MNQSSLKFPLSPRFSQTRGWTRHSLPLIIFVLLIFFPRNIKTMDISCIEKIPHELQIKILFYTPLWIFLQCRLLNQNFCNIITKSPVLYFKKSNYFDWLVKNAVINEIKLTEAYNPTKAIWKKNFTKDFYEKIHDLMVQFYIPSMLKYCSQYILANKRDDHSILNQIDCEEMYNKDKNVCNYFYDSSCKNIPKSPLVLQITTKNIDEIQEIQQVFQIMHTKYPDQKIVRVDFKEISVENITNHIINFIQKYNLYDTTLEDKNKNSIVSYLFDKKQYNIENNIHIKLLDTVRRPEDLYYYVLYHNQFDLLKILLQKKLCTSLDFFKYIHQHFKDINNPQSHYSVKLDCVLTCLDILFSNNFLNPNLVYYPNDLNNTAKRSVFHTILQSGQIEIVKIWDTYKEKESDYFLYKNIQGLHSLWQAVFGYTPGTTHKEGITEEYQKEISTFLLQKGVPSNEKTTGGNHAPLHLARIYSPELLKIFLKHGANIFIKNNYHHTPLHHVLESISYEEKLEEYINVLKKYDHNVTIESYFGTKKYIIEKASNTLKFQVNSLGQNIKILKVDVLY